MSMIISEQTRHGTCLYVFLARSQNFEKRRLALSCPSVRPSIRPPVCLSIRMEQLGCHWAAFNEIWYLSFFKNLSIDFKFH
jgi:hypothetical protein